MNKSKSFRLFVISITIVALTFLIATFWNALRLGPNKVSLAVAIMISFGISIAGLIIGFSELKKEKSTKLWIALIGHSLIILFFLIIILNAAIKY